MFILTYINMFLSMTKPASVSVTRGSAITEKPAYDIEA